MILTGWEQDNQFTNTCGWGNGGISEGDYLKLVNARQLGVSAARNANLPRRLRVYHAVELNSVPDVPGGQNVLMNIVAHMSQAPDFISYSAWGALTDTGVLAKLNTIRTVSGLPKERIFLGEFGFKKGSYTPAQIRTKIRSYADSVFGWGARLMLWWTVANDTSFAMINVDRSVHAGIEDGILGAHDEWATEPAGACTLNTRYWVFGAATTNVEYDLKVTDTLSGQVKTYHNNLGNLAVALADTNAFNTCR